MAQQYTMEQYQALLLQQQMHHKALESATEVLKLYPDSKHASALLATSQHKAGKKKESADRLRTCCRLPARRGHEHAQ